MIIRAINQYLNNFRGFSREIWILAIITFINRAGTMVLPFLSKYLKEDLHFSYSEVGWIMVCFGMGSMLGSFLGGKLSDKIGFYKVMVFSLFTSGLLFFVIQYVQSFIGLCVSMFAIMAISDMFRPAMFVSIGTYAGSESRTRALTLVRLAVNLGFAAGPALGGLIIMKIGYHGLFWVDGLTCIIAICTFAFLVKEKQPENTNFISSEAKTKLKSVYNDKIFLVFLFVSFVTAMIFFQLFTTLPLYDHLKYKLTEFEIGLLMTLNGLLIFLLEMPIVSYFEKNKISKLKIILTGALFMGFSFYTLLFPSWSGLLIISTILISFGEMFAFPFSNSFAINRAPKSQQGQYMALYTMSFSLAHIFSSKIGMEMIDHFGYESNWFLMGSFGLMAALCCIWLQKLVKLEDKQHP